MLPPERSPSFRTFRTPPPPENCPPALGESMSLQESSREGAEGAWQCWRRLGGRGREGAGRGWFHSVGVGRHSGGGEGGSTQGAMLAEQERTKSGGQREAGGSRDPHSRLARREAALQKVAHQHQLFLACLVACIVAGRGGGACGGTGGCRSGRRTQPGSQTQATENNLSSSMFQS